MYSSPPSPSKASPTPPIAATNCGTAASAIQPSATYAATTSHLGAVIHASFTTTPVSAPAHATARIARPAGPWSATTATGVYVAAISTKIIEWSSRRIQRRATSDRQLTRW